MTNPEGSPNLIMEKKVRFGDLVRNSGRPQIITLWTDPDKDPKLKHAVQQNRVLTVLEPPGKRPFGFLGLKTEPHAVFLLFPRPLPKTSPARVIGINYQLVQESSVADPLKAEEWRRKAQPKRHILTKRPARKAFTIKVRRTATVEEQVEVEALDRQAAEQAALEKAKQEPFELERAELVQEVLT